MYFEIIGPIIDIEKIAAGTRVRMLRVYESNTELVAGESSKVLPQCASEMVGYDVSNSIGMRLTDWEKGR